jgi:drug/metabolite transporter (DMT)-like permease
MSTRQLLPLIGALFALYIIWGSTYFAIAIGVASWPPLMMAGIRFLSAGGVLLLYLLATGHKLPARRPLLNAALIGILLLAVGNGFVTLAEHQHVPSGIAAVMVATVPRHSPQPSGLKIGAMAPPIFARIESEVSTI